jgi:hypothetical protein
MKPALAAFLLFFCTALGTAQDPVPSPTAGVDPVLARIQRASQATNDDVARLRIERWKTESDQKAELQKIADSVQRNISNAVPDLIKEVQSSKGSVSSTFKLYHNLNILYEYLNVLAESASNFGKSEEYAPLSRDATALDAARQDLSDYIEQAAVTLEVKAARPVATPAPPPPPQKIVIDDTPAKTATPKKKKTSTPAPKPASTPN